MQIPQVVLIGPKGGGKTTYAVATARKFWIAHPSIKVISNCTIELPNVEVVEDVWAFLAMKIALKDDRFMVFIVDEAAASGLESRLSMRDPGSVLVGQLIAFSRKAKVFLILISQMMSMIDKRSQWLADFYLLCESMYQNMLSVERGYPDYFRYTIYNNNLKNIGVDTIDGEFAYNNLFHLFKTEEIPQPKMTIENFTRYFQLSDETMADYMARTQADREQTVIQAYGDWHELYQGIKPPKGQLGLELQPYVADLEFKNDEKGFPKEIWVSPESQKRKFLKVVGAILKNHGWDFEWTTKKWIRGSEPFEEEITNDS